ncbi:MAG: AAA family ATPase [bacterium]|nr:AAA family ATPase [bacterium]
MLKLLNIKVNGYKLLEDNFTFDFLTRTKVLEADLEKEVLKIDNVLYSFRTLAIVGGNSSGKSTVLALILKTIDFLSSGRWVYVENEFKFNTINLSINFYLDGYIYFYTVNLLKNNSENDRNNLYAIIDKETLFRKKYSKAKGKKNLDTVDDATDVTVTYLQNSLKDTSAIINLVKDNILVDAFTNNNVIDFNKGLLSNSFYNILNNSNPELASSIIKLLDDSIEYIKSDSSDYVKFKRYNEEEKVFKKIELISILSSGTFRGIELYLRAIKAIKTGKVFIVDEIENCFQKNVVFNLIYLFNDAKINKKNAQLIFSTHYTEILDILNRQDSINITHKNNGKISIKNLKDYDIRVELSKSKQFDNNTFNTSINYQQLMEVRRNLINELHSNND